MAEINIHINAPTEPVYNNNTGCGRVTMVVGSPLDKQDCREVEAQRDELQAKNDKLKGELNEMSNKATELAEALNKAGITNLTLDGTILTVHTGDGDKAVDLSSILPVIGKDLFLKAVEHNDNKIVFTVGEKDNTESDKQFEVDVSDLLPVKTGNSITGDGTTNNELAVNLDPDEDNLLEITENGLNLNKDKLKALIPTGTQPSDTGSCEDCFADIPEKDFDPESAILAFGKDGKLYKFKQPENYFKDGALAMSVVKSELKDDGKTEHTISIKVTNTRNVAIPSATLRLSSANDITGLTVVNSGTATATISDNEVTIKDLPASGSVLLTAVVTNDSSSYIAGDLSLVGDVDGDNNHATLNLSSVMPSQAASNIYTDECPMVTVKSGEKVLQQSSQVEQVWDGHSSYEDYANGEFINTVETVGLNGVSLNVTGGSSVRVMLYGPEYDNLGNNVNSGYRGVTILKETSTNHYEHWVAFGDDIKEATSDDYTFDGTTLSFKTKKVTAIVYVRPGSETCKWQRYILAAKLPDTTVTVTEDRIGVTGLDNDKYSYEVVNTAGDTNEADVFTKLPFVEGAKFKTDKSNLRYFSTEEHGYWKAVSQAQRYLVDSTANIKYRLIVKLPAGQAFDFSIDRSNILPEQQGAITTKSDGKVSVLATAKPTDNVYTDRVDITVEE